MQKIGLRWDAPPGRGASEELRAEREVVLAGVKQNGEALQYASEELRADREFMLAAVQQRGWALEYTRRRRCGRTARWC